MVTYKICPYCREQIKLEAVKCRWCGEYLGAVNVVHAHEVKVKTVRLKPVKRSESIAPPDGFNPGRLVALRVVAAVTAVAFLVLNLVDWWRPRPGVDFFLVSLVALGGYIALWLMLGLMLRRFSGAARIARPLIMSAIFWGASVVFVLPVIAAAGRMPSSDMPEYAAAGSGSFMMMLAVGPLLAGLVFFIMAGARMMGAKSDWLKLKQLGYTIVFSSAAYFVLRIVQNAFRWPDSHFEVFIYKSLAFINAMLLISPLVVLFIITLLLQKKLQKCSEALPVQSPGLTVSPADPVAACPQQQEQPVAPLPGTVAASETDSREHPEQGDIPDEAGLPAEAPQESCPAEEAQPDCSELPATANADPIPENGCDIPAAADPKEKTD